MMNDATIARDLTDVDTGRDERRREGRSAEIDEVLMRLAHRVLARTTEAIDACERGEPRDPAAPLDRMIDVLDDLSEARRELDRL